MRLQELAYARQPRYGQDNQIPNGKDGHLSPSAAQRPRLPAHLVGGLEPVTGSIRKAAPLDMKQVLAFPMPSEAPLRTMLGLTAAEARLAQLLASGDTLEEVAQKLSHQADHCAQPARHHLLEDRNPAANQAGRHPQPHRASRTAHHSRSCLIIASRRRSFRRRAASPGISDATRRSADRRARPSPPHAAAR